MSKHTVQDLVFVGGGGRVVALDRYDGSVVWKWKAPRGRGFLAALSPISYVSVALDGDRLIVDGLQKIQPGIPVSPVDTEQQAQPSQAPAAQGGDQGAAQ